MALTERQRLAPSTFRLPVEKIRDGYYSDAYFNHTKALLEADDHHPHVVMQVFQRKDSVLGGIDEAIAVLKQCAGRRGPDGRWVNGFKELEVHALYEGDAISPWETVMTIEGDYSLFAHLETVYLGCLARRTLVMRNVHEVVEAAGGKPILYFPARHDTGSCRPATAGRRTSPARSACRPTRRRPGGAGAASAPSRTA